MYEDSPPKCHVNYKCKSRQSPSYLVVYRVVHEKIHNTQSLTIWDGNKNGPRWEQGCR